MNQERREKAIAWIKEEIRLLERAPELNGCPMTPEWAEQLEIMRTCLEAVRLSDFAEVSKQAEREYYAGFSSNTAHIDGEELTAEWKRKYKSGTSAGPGYVCSSCDMWNERPSWFCPSCGKAMTPEAWDELEKRLRGTNP